MVNFKKIIRIAYANGWIKTDPFANWKARLKTVEREFLTDEELQRLMDHPFTNERLEHVRDCFVFCCRTHVITRKKWSESPREIFQEKLFNL